MRLGERGLGDGNGLSGVKGLVNDGVMGMDWERIGKGLIYMAKWVFLKLLGKLRGLWEMNEIG